MSKTDFNIALTREDKNDYYLSLAKAVANGSSCPPGKQHGCLAVRHARVVSMGYNGVPTGHEHCGIDCPLDVFKRKNKGKKNFALCPAVHAEMNCLITSSMIGTAIVESVFYVTKRPCNDCLKSLRNMKLSAVVYMDDNEDHYLLRGPLLIEEVKLTYGR